MLFIDSAAFDATLNWMANGLLDFSGWQVLFVILGLTHVTIASVTIFLHRHQAHRALDLHPAVSHFFRFWLWMTTGQVTKEWAAIHRKHHAKCEQAEDGIRDFCLSRGLGDVYKRQTKEWAAIHRKHHAKCEQAEDPVSYTHLTLPTKRIV